MCSPALAISAIGTGISAVGALKQGKQQQAAYNAQSASLAQQSAQAAQDAQAALDQSYVEGATLRKQGKVAMSQTRAAYGASGVNVNFGSPLEVQTDLSQRVEHDALTKILAGERLKRRYEGESANLANEASQATAAGKNAASGGVFDALSVLATGGANVASGWISSKTPGPV